MTVNTVGLSLAAKSAVITGGASGIGQAIAELFAAHGAYVHITDLDWERGKAVAASIRQNGGSAEAHSCDVSSLSDVRRVFAAILEKGPVDVLVNNAGIAHVGNIEKTSEEEFDRLYHVNVKGMYNCLSVVVPAMKALKKGVVLNMASIAASAGLPDRFAYSMSKGAVRAMTFSVARDYLAFGIRCNCVSPARVFTPFVERFVKENYAGREKEIMDELSRAQPIGRMGGPHEVALLALYLCSDEASFITGTDYPIDGGFMNVR